MKHHAITTSSARRGGVAGVKGTPSDAARRQPREPSIPLTARQVEAYSSGAEERSEAAEGIHSNGQQPRRKSREITRTRAPSKELNNIRAREGYFATGVRGRTTFSVVTETLSEGGQHVAGTSAGNPQITPGGGGPPLRGTGLRRHQRQRHKRQVRSDQRRRLLPLRQQGGARPRRRQGPLRHLARPRHPLRRPRRTAAGETGRTQLRHRPRPRRGPGRPRGRTPLGRTRHHRRPLPDPFALWTTATTRLLAQARTAGHLADRVRPAPTARSLVRAFFGLCTLTEALEGRTAITARLTDWWLLTLGSLQQRPDPAGVLARALRRRAPRAGERMVGAASGE